MSVFKFSDQELSSIYDELVEVDDDDGFTGLFSKLFICIER